MKNDLNIDERFQTWVLLHHVRDVFATLRGEELAPYDITPRQAWILLIMNSRNGEVTLAEISQLVFQDYQVLSRLTTQMEQKGFIKRINGKGRIILKMTEKGQQVFEQTRERNCVREVMSCLSEEDLQHFYATLARLRDEALQYENRTKKKYEQP